MDATQKHLVERFDPLLRDLLAFELVEAEEEGHWTLAPEVQQRLSALVAVRRPAAAVLHIGFPCARCHASAVTRLHEGRLLCDACIPQVLEEERETSGRPPAEDAGAPTPALEQTPGEQTSGSGPGPTDVGERRLVSWNRGSVAATSTP